MDIKMFLQENSLPNVIKRHRNFGVFLPEDDKPLDLSIKSQPKKYEFRLDLKRIKEQFEYRMEFLRELEPHIQHIKEKYNEHNFYQHRIEENGTEAKKRKRSEMEDTIFIEADATKKRKRSEMEDTIIIDEEEPLDETQNEAPEEAPQFPKFLNSNMVQIGSKGTLLTATQFNKINWSSPEEATRSLLTTIFDFRTLATHSLTGKGSPAFVGRERPQKGQLDQVKVADITECVCAKFKKTNKSKVRSAITSKCAESTKKMRKMLKETPKQAEMRSISKEKPKQIGAEVIICSDSDEN